MYTLFISKYAGERKEFLITKTISEYMRLTDYPCLVLSAPGYMSTGYSMIPHFVNRFLSNLCDSHRERKVSVGFFYGMNGNHHVAGKIGGKIRDSYQRAVKESKTASLVHIRCNSDRDHRKMLFFMEPLCDLKQRNLIGDGNEIFLTRDTMVEFLDSVKVRAVLFGSSNQSNRTYYGKADGTADKGEADSLMFTEEAFFDHVLENQNDFNPIVLSQSMRVSGDDDYAFLKGILRDFLYDTLV